MAALSVSWDLDEILGNVASLLLSFGSTSAPPRLMSEDELRRYRGEPGSPGLYLSLLGHVFDVSKGQKHYGPGGGYHFFAGRDASRAFVSGDFTETGLTDDVSDLSPAEVVTLYDWLAFYQRDYKPVGRLVGRYYSDTGQPTEYLRHVEATLAEGLKLKAQAEAESKLFPSCNSEWSASAGGRVWCSTQSGGVHRNWVGVPRMLFSPGSASSRCVCVQSSDPLKLDNPNLREYEGCPPLAESCTIQSS
ncbi:neuferricin precursor-like [Scleropages formosus]|uniref:Neuferricin n=1 Tax=Scleropages formosus TaxID=113540 RepID=A0A0N8JZW5_SCLFO|nr:neuferricin precursor-like [Scleropages formosus]